MIFKSQMDPTMTKKKIERVIHIILKFSGVLAPVYMDTKINALILLSTKKKRAIKP